MRKRKWSDTELVEAVKNSQSIAGVLRTLGLAYAGGSYTNIKNHIERLNLDTSHFTGQSWSRGTIQDRTLDQFLVEGSNNYIYSSHLRRMLIKESYFEEKCHNCNLNLWMGKRIPLDLHHIDGNRYNNRLENLTILCKNCHALTENWGSKNK